MVFCQLDYTWLKRTAIVSIMHEASSCLKWAVRRRWLSAGRYGRTEPGKLKGHLSNDRAETMRLSGVAHRELGKGQKKSGSRYFRSTQTHCRRHGRRDGRRKKDKGREMEEVMERETEIQRGEGGEGGGRRRDMTRCLTFDPEFFHLKVMSDRVCVCFLSVICNY